MLVKDSSLIRLFICFIQRNDGLDKRLYMIFTDLTRLG